MGMDAEISYAFHAERTLQPEKFKNANQSTYAKLGLTQGWFVTPIYHPYSTIIAQMTKIKIMKKTRWALARHLHSVQANKIRFEFCKGAVDHTFMRIDGEPWKQHLPLDDETVVIEISHLGQVSILGNGNCRSKSVTDPCSPYAQEDEEYDSCDEEEEEEEEEVEEEKKFGAADTFRIPEGIDISCLS